jgi:hypothetical protein
MSPTGIREQQRCDEDDESQRTQAQRSNIVHDVMIQSL